MPVYLVGGFLGSGKTTLLRRLLAHELAAGRRPVVIVNEPSGTGVDGHLLRDLAGLDPPLEVREVGSGCIRCGLSQALSDGVRDLISSAHDAVFVEASGLATIAEAADAIHAAIADPRLERSAHLAAVVAVVDARALLSARPSAGRWREEVAGADTVVLNKVDLLPPGIADGLVARVPVMNGRVRVIPATYAEVSPPRLLGAGGRVSAPARASIRELRPTASFTSVTARILGKVVVPRLQRMLSKNRRRLARVKGFVRTAGAEGLYEVQWVPGTLDLRPHESRRGVLEQLVIVASHDIEWEQLTTELDGCVEVDSLALAG